MDDKKGEKQMLCVTTIQQTTQLLFYKKRMQVNVIEIILLYMRGN